MYYKPPVGISPDLQFSAVGDGYQLIRFEVRRSKSKDTMKPNMVGKAYWEFLKVIHSNIQVTDALSSEDIPWLSCPLYPLNLCC